MIHKLVALFSTMVVIGFGVVAVNALLGSWAILFWIGAIFFGFLAICARVNG